jgi:hypothetical protein
VVKLMKLYIYTYRRRQPAFVDFSLDQIFSRLSQLNRLNRLNRVSKFGGEDSGVLLPLMGNCGDEHDQGWRKGHSDWFTLDSNRHNEMKIIGTETVYHVLFDTGMCSSPYSTLISSKKIKK